MMSQQQLEHRPPAIATNIHSIHHRTFLASHVSGGPATLSGTSGFTSVTTLSKSFTTLSPVLLPASLICFTCSSASLLASSSAFLLPLVCYPSPVDQLLCLLEPRWPREGGVCGLGEHLLLKFLELVIFLLSVVFYLFLRFILGVFDAL